AALAAFLAVTLPASTACRHVTGHFSFLPASGGVNLWLGNNPDFEHTVTARVGEDWQVLLSRSDATRPDEMWEGDRWFRGRVLEWIREDPAAFLAGIGKKAARFVSSREIPRNTDLYLYREWSAPLRASLWKAGPWGFPFGVLLPLAAAGLILRRGRIPAPVLLFVLLGSAAIVGVFVAARYRAPLVPAFAVLAVEGARASWAILRTGRARARFALAAGAAAAVLLTTLPGPFPEERQPYEAELWSAVGAAHRDAGDLDAAEADYRRALETAPDHAPAWDGLGLVSARRGDLDSAVRHLQGALLRDPQSAVSHNNLGAVLLDLGRPAEAAVRFEQALRIRPSYDRAAANLRTAQARAAADTLRTEIAARPDDPEPASRLAWLLATTNDPRVRDAEEAVRRAETACRLTHRDSARELYVLATAYAAAGRSGDASATGAEALQRAESEHDEDLAAKIRTALARFGVGSPQR
ncbi:MAG TPA: tetratricopeptide repeat protein, partial [bacterium]|nr:tetratricopeptide repeat protein [bacterium]